MLDHGGHTEPYRRQRCDRDRDDGSLEAPGEAIPIGNVLGLNFVETLTF